MIRTGQITKRAYATVVGLGRNVTTEMTTLRNEFGLIPLHATSVMRRVRFFLRLHGSNIVSGELARKPASTRISWKRKTPVAGGDFSVAPHCLLYSGSPMRTPFAVKTGEQTTLLGGYRRPQQHLSREGALAERQRQWDDLHSQGHRPATIPMDLGGNPFQGTCVGSDCPHYQLACRQMQKRGLLQKRNGSSATGNTPTDNPQPGPQIDSRSIFPSGNRGEHYISTLGF